MGYFKILAAIPGFSLSSLFLMLLGGVIAPKIGIVADISYVTAMLITITLWIAVAPLAAVVNKKNTLRETRLWRHYLIMR